MRNPFLNDLEEDTTALLIEKGNLPGYQQKPPPISSQWVSEGYLARISRYTCRNCGAKTDFLLGVFHRESAPGKSRETPITAKGSQFPAVQKEYYPTQTPICVNCLP